MRRQHVIRLINIAKFLLLLITTSELEIRLPTPKTPKCIFQIVVSAWTTNVFTTRNNHGTFGSIAKKSRGVSARVLPLESSAPVVDQTFATFEALLWNLLSNNDTTSITLEGYVLSKRSLGKGLVFVDFHIPGFVDTCQAMLRQEYYLNMEELSNVRKLLLKGTKLMVQGRAAPTRNPGNAVLLIENIQFLTFPRQMQYIQILTQEYFDGNIAKESFEKALPLETESDDANSIMSNLQSLNTALEDKLSDAEGKKRMKCVSRLIFDSLPDDPDYPKEADQVQYSKQGSYNVPTAPPEWKEIPAILKSQVGRERKQISQDSAPIRLAIEEVLAVENDVETSNNISIKGWVQNRRRFDGNITMLALVDSYASILAADVSDVDTDQNTTKPETRRLLCILHPDLVSAETAGIFRNLAAVGSQISIQGRFASKESGAQRKYVWIESISLEQSTSRSMTVTHLLDLLHDQKLDREHVYRALRITSQQEKDSLQDLDPTQRQWKANELAVRLQNIAVETVSGEPRELLVDPSLLKILERYKSLAKEHPIDTTTLQDMEELLMEEAAAEVECAKRAVRPSTSPLPMGMPRSKWQRKKRPQLSWMGMQIQRVLQSHPEYGRRRLQILDIGGGKGLLASYLGQTLRDQVEVHVVDICAGAIANGEQKAYKMNLPVEFSLADASQALNVTADVVVALHACGHLSDVALAHAVQRGAGFVIVPCCFNSNPHLKIPGTEESGNQVSVTEWLGIENEDWSALKLLAEVQGNIQLANEAIASICALRAKAVCRLRSDFSQGSVSIKRFPIEFSTRNTVLVGNCITRRLGSKVYL